MCLFFWQHDFTKWKTTKEGIMGEQMYWLGHPLGEKRATGRYVDQRRKCKKCDLVQLRTEEASL